jgi:prepilin-type N-terminal cleavage/methylation domain-containing protein
MNRRAGAPWRDSEAGFTLIELLVVIVLLAVIAVPAGNVVIGILHNTDATNARLAASHDAQIAAAYFAADVASTGVQLSPGSVGQSVELNAAYDAGLFPCGTVGTPPAALRVAWDEYTTAGGTPTRVVVAYVVETAGGRSLHRIRCQGSTTPSSDVVVAHRLGATDPTPTCSSACTAVPAPQRVTLTLALTDPGGSGSYSVVLTGQRRQT